MGLKILHTADWHLDTSFASFPELQRQKLRQEQRKIPGRILELAHAEQVDLVLLAGDLFDGPATKQSVDLLRHTLREFGVPVFVAPGNHDFCAPGSPWLEENWPENVHVFTGAMESVVLPELNCRVYGAGYQSMDCPPLLQDFHAEGQERYCICVLHADPMVRQSPCCAITAAQVRESGLDYLALGHIHKTGSFLAGETLCAWPGCPAGRGWDETGEKGVCIVTLEDSVQVRAVPLGFSRFYDLETEVEDDGITALEQMLPATSSEDYYRITLTGFGQPDLDGLTERFRHIPNLQLRDRTQHAVALWTELEEDSLRGTYFRLLRDSGDPRAKLAAEISQKLLSGREVLLP